jgi:aldose 1-epimerase
MSSLLNSDPYLAVRQAFDAPWPGPRGDKITLRSANLKAVIYPADGCRLTSLSAFGYELLRQWNPQRKAFQYGCFPMIPWVGRLDSAILNFAGNRYPLPMNKPPHALHGMSCFAPWQTVNKTENSATFVFELDHPWPWRGQVRQTFELSDDSLTITLTVTTDEHAFPAAAGWHPWFAKWTGSTEQVAAAPIGDESDQLRLLFNADWQEEPGDNELPTGKRITPLPGPWDDCFGFNDKMNASLVWPDKVRLDMTSPATAMVIFDKQPDAACVEPLSGPPNSVNSAPQLVSKGSPLIVTTVWALRRL